MVDLEPNVSEIIREYESMVELEGHSDKHLILEKLEKNCFLNWEDWEKIRIFFGKHHFDARLELITKRLIKKIPPRSAKPYFVLINLLIKSDRLTEAHSLLEDCRRQLGESLEYQWDSVNVLFQTRQFEKCFREVQLIRSKGNDGVGYACLEVKSLWQLGERRLAKKQFKKILPLLKQRSENWIWYLYLAIELKDTSAVINAEKSIVKLVEDGNAYVSTDMLFALIHTGRKEATRRIISYADPMNFKNISDAMYVFELASGFGDFKISTKFGSAILAQDPNTRLRSNIEQLLSGDGFLMA